MRAPFGTVLGETHGGVKVFSCDYKTKKLFKMESFSMYHLGQYTGYKWQCVELARRYLVANSGITFKSIPMAYHIFELEYFTRISSGALVPVESNKNGSKSKPEKGSLLIWEPKGYFKTTGHVAVITNVEKDYVDIVEQNVHDSIWKKGCDYSRRLKMESGTDGEYRIHCTYSDTEIKGWINLKEGDVITEEKSATKKPRLCSAQ